MRGEQNGGETFEEAALGSPPHARGAEHENNSVFGEVGITPACAGSSNVGTLKIAVPWDHPRMRGEQGALSG